MGQQQLLLIVLGVIIVGIAVVVGINVFTASSLEANKSALVSDLQTIASMAQQYYRKPTGMGGGGNSFTNWTLPPALTRTANMSSDVTVTTAAGDVLELVATGTEQGSGGTEITVTLYADQNNIDSVKFANE